MHTSHWLGILLTVGAVLAADPAVAESDAGSPHDDLAEANEASLIVLHRAGLIEDGLAGAIACELHALQEAEVGRQRAFPNYLDTEQALIEALGPDGNSVHLGRSRQDLHETVRRMAVRRQLLAAFTAQHALRESVIELASRHPSSVVPAYTHGVQAQPTTFGHQLLAYADAFGRDAKRLRAAYATLNVSPLGSAALATSAFELDRDRLASLLGFDAAIANSFDANLIASIDHKTELAAALSTSALIVGQWVEGVHRQYQHTSPWLLLDTNSTSRSSLMPQKANPRPLDRLRLAASETVANAHRVALVAHNLPAGMHDYRDLAALLATLDSAVETWQRMTRIVEGLRLDEARALAEVDAEYGTSTALADWLFLNTDLPLSIAYQAASNLAKTARAAGLTWAELSDEALRGAIKRATGQVYPGSLSELRGSLDANAMIASRRTSGGPQPESVEALLRAARQSLATDRQWLESMQAGLTKAGVRRARALKPLLAGCRQ